MNSQIEAPNRTQDTTTHSTDTSSSQSAALASDSPKTTHKLSLEPNDARRLANLCGQFDEHIKQIEKRLGIKIRNRGNEFALIGQEHATHAARLLLKSLYGETHSGETLTPDQVHLALQEANVEAVMMQATEASDTSSPEQEDFGSPVLIRTKKCTVKPRGLNQQHYVQAVQKNDINFGIGPAGTGKTYLAVACAVESLLNDNIERILLVRPAVEAGEKLGFLPGDLSQKVDPYLRPLYDALYEMLGFETVDKLIERNVIEVAPLAYMRGRTLNNAFVILDESQNTTREQMKMFLTRIGFGTTAVINGDPSQIDLPKGQASGLRHATNVLENVNGISFTYFGAKDVVRHPLVQRIVEAYDAAEAAAEQAKKQAQAENANKAASQAP
ncbi:PhoH family protein [Marinibactrum halimedae]|uniref:PhoH-like protein n=1 Tax=Marinibactrum halimedae TaxID=1444977 RepID=A0AA37T8R7_9GAMM|nr:PhoH family protein [Marinibactrum halimedae]MCD9457409.1 PhoH family protein [Marinibactrum halimedae]GLS25540.1 PhoH family protein [Marinibactrum halimedae]